MTHAVAPKRTHALILSAGIGLALLAPADEARGTGWKPNVEAGSDIVMKDHRWPFWDQGTYYCFWYMSFVPQHPRLGSFYGGIAVSGAKKAPGMFMSYWGEVRPVHEGRYFYPHGYGAEGASGGAHGDHVGFGRRWASLAEVGRAVALAGDEHAMPAEDRRRGEQRPELLEQSLAKSLAFYGEVSFLLGVEEESFAAQLLPQDAVLRPQEVDYCLLLPIHPAGNSHDNEMPRCPGHGRRRYRPMCRGSRELREEPDGTCRAAGTTIASMAASLVTDAPSRVAWGASEDSVDAFLSLKRSCRGRETR